MTRKDVIIFAAGLLVGSAATYFSHLQGPRLVYHLQTDLPPTVELAPPEPTPADGTLTFQNEDIRAALQRLGRAAGVKLYLSDQVQGLITFIFDDPKTSPREAIRLIAVANHLIVHESDGILFVKTAAERSPEPTEQGLYTFHNARASDAKPLLVRQLRSTVEPSVDERTNTIFYTETRSNVEEIEKFLQFLDQPVAAQK